MTRMVARPAQGLALSHAGRHEIIRRRPYDLSDAEQRPL
jgi:hypothetical protein